MLKLIWTEEAIRNLESIIDYIAERNYPAAVDLEARVHACTERLPNHPFMHRNGRVAGTREAVVHPNYIVIYRVGEDRIDIVEVIHARRRYPSDPR